MFYKIISQAVLENDIEFLKVASKNPQFSLKCCDETISIAIMLKDKQFIKELLISKPFSSEGLRQLIQYAIAKNDIEVIQLLKPKHQEAMFKCAVINKKLNFAESLLEDELCTPECYATAWMQVDGLTDAMRLKLLDHKYFTLEFFKENKDCANRAFNIFLRKRERNLKLLQYWLA